MNADEAVRRAEEWLRNSPDGDLTTGGTAALRIRADYVVPATGGWNVTYNTVGWLDGTDPGKGLFPSPVVFVPEDGGEIAPDLAMTASGAGVRAEEGFTEWVDVVDPEFDREEFPELTVPRAAVLGWEQRTLYGHPTGVYRDNPEYKIGPLAIGHPKPSTATRKLIGYAEAHWITPQVFAANLLDLDVYLALDAQGGPLQANGKFCVYSSPEAMPAKTTAWRRVQPRVLLRGKPEAGLWFDRESVWAPLLPASLLAAAQGPAPHPELEHEPVDEVPAELGPEVTAAFPALAEEFGQQAVNHLRGHLVKAGEAARKNGYALSVEECLTYARRYCRWIVNLRAGREPNPTPWTLGKFSPHLATPEMDVAWHRLLGAYVGFAIGDALGSGADPTGDLPLGGLTRQLLLHTESLIRGLPSAPEPQGIPATLPAVGRPDSWVTQATADAGPAPAEFSALLAAALPAAVSTAAFAGEPTNDHYARAAAREMIGAMASGTEVGTATDSLVWLLRRALSPVDGRLPLWHFMKSLDVPNELVTAVLTLRDDRKADDDVQLSTLGDGSTPRAVLGRALLAASKWGHDPERALTLAAAGGPVAGALAGAFVGAKLGVPGLPPKWIKALTSLRLLDTISADAFHYFNRWGVADDSETLETTWAERYPRGNAAPKSKATPWRAAPETRSRLRGSLLAGAIGDALGAKTEFDSIERIREIAGPAGITDFIPAYGGVGRITDDTQMTLFTLEAVIRAHAQLGKTGSADLVESLQLAYQRWLHTQGVAWTSARGPENPSEEPDGWLVTNRQLFSRRAPGLTCFSELEAYGKTGVRASVDRPVNNSKGCGGVMRAAPIALWSDDLAEVFELGAASAALTHGHPSGFLSSGAFAVIMNLLLQGKPLLDAVAAAQSELVKHAGHEEQTVALEQALKLAQEGPPTPEKLATLGEGNIGETALSMSVYVALATTDVNSALLASVNHSGDSDSTGSVCGNLVGAMYGEQALRQDLVERLELREVIEALAEDALSEFGPDAPSDDRWYERYPAH